MIRRLLTALVLILVALVLLAFAVANRQVVTVSLDPFDQANPAVVFSQPLYLLVFALLIVGVVLGGCAAWLRQSKWRGRARRAEAQLGPLRAQSGREPARSDTRPRLVIPPPAA
ncbi:MAG TPA: LapA family protein [Xanthobacteraceae bacterium]|jgi:uncharacterized integral membrane protein